MNRPREDIVNAIGSKYRTLTPTTELGEWAYPLEFKRAGLKFNSIQSSKSTRTYSNLDLRFVDTNARVSVLVETKVNFMDNLEEAKEQLSAYVEYEKELTNNRVIAMLANTGDSKIMVWRGAIADGNFLEKETAVRTMEEYVDFYTAKINDKETVMQNTYDLNSLLYKYGVSEKLRSQLVGTCLLALKNGLEYNSPKVTTAQLCIGIKECLGTLLNAKNTEAEKKFKLDLLYKNVLENQVIRSMPVEHFRDILRTIETKILPYINDKSTAGQDILNLFFITFNKYVGKDNKNQAFTPDHITDFMTKITQVKSTSRVLDICCGSGAFLVRAMTQALDDCATEKEQEKVKSQRIYGIEYDENIFGLATTNMLIHGDGNTNIVKDNCFNRKDWIINTVRPTVCLLNPPYNAVLSNLSPEYTKNWGKNTREDPTKGLCFVQYLSDIAAEMREETGNEIRLAVLLPVACAIGTSKELKETKKAILEKSTLDAVFTLPNEVFYPGASASACCMVFRLGTPHKTTSNPPTFFGYYKEDGFKKKKNLGRVEQKNADGSSKWVEIEQKWIDTYKNREVVAGFSAKKEVTAEDEWLCEAYMETDYSKLTEVDFQATLNNYLAYLIKEGKIYES